MAQARQNAKSQDREALPLPMRVYGLEGIVATQDEAIGQQGVTLSEHDARIRAQEVLSAVQANTQMTMQKSFDALVGEMQKTRWTLVAFAFTVAASAVGISLK